MELSKLQGVDRSELSLVEVAHAMLTEKGEIFDFEVLLEEVQNYLGFDDHKLEQVMVRFYTDLNTDGRFISLGDNRWALRSWYAIDEIDEEIINSMEEEDIPRLRRRRKKRTLSAFSDEDEDIIDYNDDDPEDMDGVYDEDYEEELSLEDEDEDDDIEVEHNTDDDDEDDSELGVYERDLDELGEDEIDDEEFDETIDDEDFEDEDELED